ncbi:hypothetical protein AGOR_G00192510 [Albula goreensis]|uniref:Phosphoglucomutase n=1 Tax=Albula goreensis TaxID=1534307 RepID=A0A8T3CUG6_9TELE|nr:hypothetical protein AGOR_G00192510 [Albula goreensis]
MDNDIATTGDIKLDHAIKQWMRFDKNPKTLAAVRGMVKEREVEKLKRCFGARMEFGTAGLRAAMGPGISQMNDLTIIQTTQGFCTYLEKSFPDLKERGVVIGHHTHTICALHCIPSQTLCWDHGDSLSQPKTGQWLQGLLGEWSSDHPPHDKGIASAIEENLEPWPQSWEEHLAQESPLVKDPYQDINREYFKAIQEVCFNRSINKSSEVKFIHTSVHGVGHAFVQSAFRAFDLRPPFAVPEQKDPDPEFPTVKYPNPEEGEGVLTLSFKLANKEGATVVLANDPDADRLAVAEKQESGQWRVSQEMSLAHCWAGGCFVAGSRVSDSTKVKEVYMLASTVSSKILRAIALKEGFHFEETLTGFKWMGNRAKQLLDQGKMVLFAFEEAIGYMCCPAVLDKDGVSAAAIAAELTSYLATKDLSLSQQLKAIYDEYGYHITKNSYFICHDQDIIRQLFERLRNYDGENTYPKTCGGFTVSGVRDLTTGYDSDQQDKKAVLPTSKSSQMITFTFSNGGVATMRTSGTEPKIKYYTELCAAPGNSDLKQLKMELDDLVDAIVENFFEPKKNNLEPKPE